MIYKLSFRGTGDYGPVMPGRLNRWNNPAGIPASKALHGFESVTFLVHGFNVGKLEGEASLAELTNHLHSSNTEAIVFTLWPGDSPIGPLSYPFTEGNQAIDTAQELHRCIQDHVSPGTRLNFISHSLGCRVVLETINNLYKAGHMGPRKYHVSQVCLMAAAVDDYCMSIPDQYKAAVNKVDRLVVLSSVKDKVLKYIYPMGDLLQSFIYFWKETFGLALGYHGPVNYYEETGFGDEEEDEAIEHTYPANVKPVPIPKKLDVDHGDYLPSLPMNDKQKKAAQFANAIITGEEIPAYDHIP